MVAKKILVEDVPDDRVEVVLLVGGKVARMVWTEGALWASPCMVGLSGLDEVFAVIATHGEGFSVRTIVDRHGVVIRLADLVTADDLERAHDRFLEIFQGGAACG